MAFTASIYRCYKGLNTIRDIAKNISLYHVHKAKYSVSLSIETKKDALQPATDALQPVADALQPATEDLSAFTNYFSNTFNLAAYVNDSDTLKHLVSLNVNLSKIEKKPHIVQKILKLNFERDMKGHIVFLSDYVGMEEIGNFITKNPLILSEPLEDLQVRVNYLESKGFKNDQIQRIITANPFWLMFSTIRIDRRFGYYQTSLKLCGNEVRYLATKQPNLITYNLHHVRTNMFVLKEEMGFDDIEIKDVVLNKPRLLMLNQRNLFERFNYIHNVMKISHKTILQHPEILFCRNFKVKQRHLFLEKLGRSQYDPKKENFVPVKSLVEDSDVDFCRKFAKCSVYDFNLFLKSL